MKPVRLPDFRLFLTRIFLFDFFSIGILPITEGLIFTILYICLLRVGGHPMASAAIALALTEVSLVVFCIAIKKSLVGNKWGADDSTPFWSWRHFAYFFAQDCFFVWCRGASGFCAGTVLSNSILRWMGCRIGRPNNRDAANAVLRLERGELRQRLRYRWRPAVSQLREHDAEGEANATSRTAAPSAFGATVMGGAVIERDTTLLPLSLVLKEMHLGTATYEGSPAEPVSVTR